MNGDMKTKRFLMFLAAGVCLLNVNVYGQWPKPADFQWKLDNITPYFDTVKLDLEVVAWSDGSQREPVQLNFETTEDWQVHALLIFMGVQARSYTRFIESDAHQVPVENPMRIIRIFYFDDWTVYIRAREEKGSWSLNGTLVHVSREKGSSESFNLLEFSSL